jgi:hypothetical protein
MVTTTLEGRAVHSVSVLSGLIRKVFEDLPYRAHALVKTSETLPGEKRAISLVGISAARGLALQLFRARLRG